MRGSRESGSMRQSALPPRRDRTVPCATPADQNPFPCSRPCTSSMSISPSARLTDQGRYEKIFVRGSVYRLQLHPTLHAMYSPTSLARATSRPVRTPRRRAGLSGFCTLACLASLSSRRTLSVICAPLDTHARTLLGVELQAHVLAGGDGIVETQTLDAAARHGALRRARRRRRCDRTDARQAPPRDRRILTIAVYSKKVGCEKPADVRHSGLEPESGSQ